jgi:hypothetical protein
MKMTLLEAAQSLDMDAVRQSAGQSMFDLANGSTIDLTSMPLPEKVEGWPREFEPVIKDFRRPGYLTRRHHFIPRDRLGAWRRYMRRTGQLACRARMAHGARGRRR